MPADPSSDRKLSLWQSLKARGVLRVAFSYLVIAWLVLQIGDVVLDPMGAPAWVMKLLITITAVGLPVSLVLAWFLEITPTGIEVDHLPEGATRPTVKGIRHYADIVIIGALVIAVVFLLYRQEGLIPEEKPTPIIGILPFEELDSSADNHFGDGFANTLIQKLGVLDQLVVLASSSSFEFRGAELTPTEVAKKLGASVLLQGSMRRAGGLLRLSVSLVDGSSGQQLWAGNYRRPMTEMFQVQDELAFAVSSALDISMTEKQVERISKPPTSSLAAYDVYLRASREALESRDADRITLAVQYLHDAIEIDPDFALAHATLVEALHLLVSYRHWETKWSDVAEEARAAARRAQELDPNLGEGYLAEAFVALHEQDNNIIDHPNNHLVSLTEKALELSPNNAVALKMLGSLEDDEMASIDLLTRAARIDPRSGIIRVNIAENWGRLGEYDKLEEWLMRAARATDPYFKFAYKALAEMQIYVNGRLDRAARWGRAYDLTYPNDWASKVSYSRALLALGAWPELKELLGRVSLIAETGDETMAWIYAHKGCWVAFAQGDTERAVPLAERDIRENLLPTPDWPDLSGQNKVLLTSLDLLALVDLQNGNAQLALDRYESANLKPEQMSLKNFDRRALRPAVIYAILYRYTGQPEETDRLLRGLLTRLENEPIFGASGKGFTEFTIHAFLGDTDAAIAALKAAFDQGWFLNWWSLDYGSFDANYAAVLEDERYQEIFQEIITRAESVLDSFRSDPDLPQDLLLEAGLDPGM